VVLMCVCCYDCVGACWCGVRDCGWRDVWRIVPGAVDSHARCHMQMGVIHVQGVVWRLGSSAVIIRLCAVPQFDGAAAR
jgi:hypothetical protein